MYLYHVCISVNTSGLIRICVYGCYLSGCVVSSVAVRVSVIVSCPCVVIQGCVFFCTVWVSE